MTAQRPVLSCPQPLLPADREEPGFSVYYVFTGVLTGSYEWCPGVHLPTAPLDPISSLCSARWLLRLAKRGLYAQSLLPLPLK